MLKSLCWLCNTCPEVGPSRTPWWASPFWCHPEIMRSHGLNASYSIYMRKPFSNISDAKGLGHTFISRQRNFNRFFKSRERLPKELESKLRRADERICLKVFSPFDCISCMVWRFFPAEALISSSYLKNRVCERHIKAFSNFAVRVLGDRKHSLHEELSKIRSHTPIGGRCEWLPSKAAAYRYSALRTLSRPLVDRHTELNYYIRRPSWCKFSSPFSNCTTALDSST